ncbi:MAG: hypothetical protein VYD90_10730 [Pseudomonadota bacterium]|nr:hypothetical protein [Pseudomonadota bacterium]
MMRAAWDWLRGETKLEAIAAAIMAVMILAGSAKILIAWHDASVIEKHEAKQAADTAKRALEAERNANANAAKRAELAKQREEDLANAQILAETASPERAAGAVGPATRAVTDELRRKQELRKAR